MGHSCRAALSDPAAPANSPSQDGEAEQAESAESKKKRKRGQALVRRRAAPEPLRAVFVTDEEVGRAVGRAGNAVRHVNLVLARAVGAEARLYSRLMRCLSERWEGSAALDSAPKPHLSAPGKKTTRPDGFFSPLWSSTFNLVLSSMLCFYFFGSLSSLLGSVSHFCATVCAEL